MIKWTIILYIVATQGSAPIERHRVIDANSEKECLAQASSDAKRILSDHPSLMAIGIACEQGMPTDPLPGVDT